MKKVYTVTLSDESKCDEIHDLICSTTDNISNIPNENIQCVNRKSHSKLRTSYRLTDNQVNILRNNPDILSIDLDRSYYHDDDVMICSDPTPSFKYPETTYCFRPQNRYFNRRNYTASGGDLNQTGTFYIYDFPWQDMNHPADAPSNLRQPYTRISENIKSSISTNSPSYYSRAFLEPTNVETEDANVVSWGKIRTKYKYNPWAGITSCFIMDDNISSTRGGEDVDLVVMDEGIDKAHPEFLDENGVSRVKDIIIDGPEHVDPTYFSSNPSKTYIDWWENASNRSASFQSLGTVTVPRYTCLVFAMQSYSTISTWEGNVGNKVIQTIGGSEYSRGTIKEVLDFLGDQYFAVKVQLDIGKPHFRYLSWAGWGNPYGNVQPTPINQPCYLTVDPDGSAILQSAPNQAAGSIYDTESVLKSNPNNAPVDSTGTFNISTTMDIKENSNVVYANVTSGSPVVTITQTTNSSLLDDIFEYDLEYVKPISGVIGAGTTIIATDLSATTFTMSSNALSTRNGVRIRISNNYNQANNWNGATNMSRDYGANKSSYNEYDWDVTTNPSTFMGYTLEYKMGLDNRTHGTHCASEAAGKNFGYASKCNIWNITVDVSGGNFANLQSKVSIEDGFDFVKIFHQAKSNNPKYGDKDPTILSGSFGTSTVPFGSLFDTASSYISDNTSCSYNYRGSSSTFSFKNDIEDMSSTPGFIRTHMYKFGYRIGNKMWNTNYVINLRTQLRGSAVNASNPAYKTAGEECLNAGVHMCFAAGNSNTYVVKDPSHQDYNNSFTNPRTNVTYYLNRVGSPADISGSINVGALSCTTRIDGTERKDYYSSKGPGIDLYAPALNTFSADSFKKELINLSLLGGSWRKPPFRNWRTQYYPDNEKDIIYKTFSGTSSACPQAAGVLVTFLEKNRTATTAQAKEWLLGTSSSYSTAGSYIDTNILNESYSGFWPDPGTYSTNVSAYNEQTYSIGDDSIVLDANHHIAYSETADALLDTDIKILYNPYSDIVEYDSTQSFVTGKGLTLSGVTIKYT